MEANAKQPRVLLDGHVHSEDATDEMLIHYLQAGCDRCFDLLFARYWRLVMAISWKILRERSAAEDVVQDVFLTIYLKSNLYDSTRGSIKTWIAQFAHFKSLMKRRHLHAQEVTCLEELTHFESEMSGFCVHEEVLERAALVEECLSSLNARQRRAIELIHFDGYTLLETSEILKETLANTKNLYYRGMKALRLSLVKVDTRGAKEPVHVDHPLAATTYDSIILGADL